MSKCKFFSVFPSIHTNSSTSQPGASLNLCGPLLRTLWGHDTSCFYCILQAAAGPTIICHIHCKHLLLTLQFLAVCCIHTSARCWGCSWSTFWFITTDCNSIWMACVHQILMGVWTCCSFLKYSIGCSAAYRCSSKWWLQLLCLLESSFLWFDVTSAQPTTATLPPKPESTRICI